MKNRFLQFGMTAKAAMIALLLGVAGKIYAYDFSAVCETGQTLYYNIIDAENHYVELTYPVANWEGYEKPSGNMLLPDSELYNGVLYSVTSIYHWTFSDCVDLIGTLIIPHSIVSIGNGAFSGCIGISGSLIIPNSVTTIGESAFYNCSEIVSISIPESVIEIGAYAFAGTNWYNNQPTGVLYLDNCCLGYKGSKPSTLLIQDGTRIIGASAFYNCPITGSLILPNTLVSIGNSAFFGCSGITGPLEIPNSVVTIGNYAFSGCYGFTGSLEIPNSVITIGHFAFSGCGFNGTLTIGNAVETIGNGAFRDCDSFTGELVIPNSVISINEYAFSGCTAFSGTVTFPNSVVSIGYQAFYYCSGISSFTIPDSVRSIGADAFKGTGWYNNQQNGVLYIDNCCIGYKGNQPTGTLSLQESTRIIADNAFSGCTGLSGDLIIPNNVAYIGNLSFSGCSGFSGALYLGNSVMSLGNMTFGSCSNLIEIVSISNVPPKMVAGGYFFSFKNVPNTIPVYVPYDKKDTYMSALGWSGFTNYQGLMYKSISGYNEGNNCWQFIASPLEESTVPTEINDMLPTTGTYDLYRFDQTENAEWRNYKADNFNLVNGQGYLYANAEDVNLIFKGTFNEDETKNVGLVYDANANFAGWNLVGNPFPMSAYTNRSYYVMNEDGTAIEPMAVSNATAVPVCTGIMVKAESEGESVTFSKTAPETQGQNKGSLQIAVAEANTRSNAIQDKAIVSFNEGDALEKFVFNEDNAKLYIPQGNKDFAIAFAEKQGEMPLNFKAMKNGEYTITIHPEAVELDYLHLIDNMTGNDIDLLASPSYSFYAQTTDYESRFKLVFSNNNEDGPSTGSGTFAFYSNGSIIINGEGTIQVIDMTGHIIVSDGGHTRCVPTTGMASGVYVLRLIDGDDVKTQKIVVR